LKQPKSNPTKAQLHALYGTTDFKRFDDMPDYTPPTPTKKRKPNPNRQSEASIQRKIITWFGRTYPDKRDLLCYNNTNSFDATRQMIDKSLGLRSGRNDLSLYYRGRALLLELKTPTGRQSDAQKEFERVHTESGNHYRVAHNFEDAQKIITNFIEWCDK
jgi:hypothetical protein